LLDSGSVGVSGTIPVPDTRMGDPRVPFQEREQYVFASPEQVMENDEPVGMDGEDAYLDGGGPKDLSTRGAFIANRFKGPDQARHSAEMRGRVGVATRRQNFLIPPRRNRAFPLVEFA